VVASSEAEPFVVLAASLAAVAQVADLESVPESPAPRSLLEAAGALKTSGWIAEWLGSVYVDNTIPLLEHEAALFDDVVSDWEIERYWSAS